MPAFLEVVLIGFAILALLGVIFEEVIHINKAKTTLFFGSISWLLMFMFAGSTEQQDVMLGKLDHNLLEIATLWLFLMATMTFVAYLNAKGLIQTLVQRVCPQQMSKRSLMVMVAVFAMILSMICDNVTATLVTLGLVHAFNLDNRTRIKLAVLVVFAVNSGGVALITGDVTTLMIFLAGHVTMLQLFVLVMPAMIGVLDLLTSAYAQFSPTVANYSAGIFSALIDNVPLTAALLKASPTLATPEWLGLTYAVGVGGSLLAIGSAAGIIAMSKVKGLTFGSHIRYFPFLFIAYTLGYWVTITLAKMMF